MITPGSKLNLKFMFWKKPALIPVPASFITTKLDGKSKTYTIVLITSAHMINVEFQNPPTRLLTQNIQSTKISENRDSVSPGAVEEIIRSKIMGVR